MNSLQRYSRQLILPGIGREGQLLLLNAKVLVIGAGGLGCPVLQYLAAAGVGNIGIADGDVVDLTNLHRQVLYGMQDIGQPKALTAKAKLRQINPGCNISVYETYIDSANAFEIIEPYDIVVDGSDNFATRYLVNDVCVSLNKTLVYGAVQRFEGQVAVFNSPLAGNQTSAQYRDIYPEPPAEDAIPNCAEAGVLGVLPGIIGAMQANEVIKLITGVGTPLVNKLLTYNALNNLVYELKINPTEAGRKAVPATKELIEATNYNFHCEPTSGDLITTILCEQFENFFDPSKFEIVDVREYGEKPEINSIPHRQIPLSLLRTNGNNKHFEKDVVLFCQTGVRSMTAASIVAKNMESNQRLYVLEGGITAWINYKNKLK